MKTPSPHRAFRRIIAMFALLWLVVIPLGRGATGSVVFQISPGRQNHTFRLWQEVPGQNPRAWDMVPGALVVHQPSGPGSDTPLYREFSVTYADVDFVVALGEFWVEDLSDGGATSPPNQIGLAGAHFRSPAGGSTLYLTIPETMQNGVFTLEQAGASYPVTNGEVQGERVGPLHTFSSYSFFEAWATFDPARPFWVVNHATQKRWPDFAANLTQALSADFTGVSPILDVLIRVPANDASRMFCLHDNSTSASWVRPVAEGTGATAGVFVRGRVGLGRTFWLVRGEDGKQSPTSIARQSVANQVIDWRSGFIPDLGPVVRDLQPLWIWVRNATDMGDPFQVVHADGYLENLIASNDTWVSRWDEFGNVHYLLEYTLNGLVDASIPWTVRNSVSGIDYGQTNLIEIIPGFGGNAPAGMVGLNDIPISRETHELWVVSDTGPSWRVPSEPHQYSMEGFSDGTLFIQSDVWRFQTYASGETQSTWWVEDRTLGDQSPSFTGSEGYFNGWFPPANSLQFQVSPTRWNHDLYLVQPFQGMVAVSKGSIQGMWTLDPAGSSQFTTFGYFDAAVPCVPGLDWWLLDGTTGELSAGSAGTALFGWAASDAETDSDGDMLPDWYEATIGSNLFAEDTDEDGISDFDEVRMGLSPVQAFVILPPGEGHLEVYTHLE